MKYYILSFCLAIFCVYALLSQKAHKTPTELINNNSARVVPSPTPKSIVVPLEADILAIKPISKYLTDSGYSNREKAIAWIATKWEGDNLTAFDNIIKKESGYRADVINEIGAGGLCQAYPASKMPCNLSDSDLMCQLEWCNEYIVRRYGTPSKAWEFHIENNWF